MLPRVRATNKELPYPSQNVYQATRIRSCAHRIRRHFEDQRSTSVDHLFDQRTRCPELSGRGHPQWSGSVLALRATTSRGPNPVGGKPAAILLPFRHRSFTVRIVLELTSSHFAQSSRVLQTAISLP